MSLAPLLAAPIAIQMHAVAAILALALAVIQLARIKAGGLHRALGWGFVTAMAMTAISSFWIVGRSGQYSWIHLLSIYTLVSLLIAVMARRRGNIQTHKWTMIGIVVGLLAAGAFTLLPGRIMGRVVFGG